MDFAERVPGRGITSCNAARKEPGSKSATLPPRLDLLQGPLAWPHQKPWAKGAVCAFTSQPPEAQSRLGRMWASQEGVTAHLPGTSLLSSSDGMSWIPFHVTL